MINNSKEVNMRCDCCSEMVTFIRHDWEHNDINYELTIEDAYCGGDYMGIKGRFKRAWKAFWAKPLYYTGVYCEDGKRMRKFLEDCLSLMDEVGEYQSTKEDTFGCNCVSYGADDADCWCE